MKTAVSIPDELFNDAERLANRLQTSRSRLYARALAEFIARHDEDAITTAMNQVVDELDEPIREFVKKAARKTLRGVEW